MDANLGADDEEMVSFNDVVEWYLLSPLSVKEMPHLEDAVPGFTAALVRWMIESTYSASREGDGSRGDAEGRRKNERCAVECRLCHATYRRCFATHWNSPRGTVRLWRGC